MPAPLDRQLEAYRRALPDIQKRKEFGWALVAGDSLIRVFSEFEDAAHYADEHYPSEEVLIRHTAEEQPVIPFLVVAR